MTPSAGSGQVPSRIFIVGPRGSGKSEFARMLSEQLSFAAKLAARFPERDEPWPVIEMSHALMDGIAAIHNSVHPDKLAPSEMQVTKDLWRRQLVALGDCIDRIAPGALLTHAAAAGKIVVGCRRRSEVNAYYAQLSGRSNPEHVPWVTHAWVFIERPGVGVEWDRFEREFFEMQVCKYHLTNNGDLALLDQNAARLARELMGVGDGSN